MNLIAVKNIIDKYDQNDMMAELRKLYGDEPHIDGHQRLILRVVIMGYELGAIQEAVLRNASERLPDNIKRGHIENGKLGMADLLTQLKMLCFELGWDYRAIERLGVEHLKERHVDFKKEGWCEE